MSLQDQAPDLVGAEFAQWEIEELIGGGGFAWVYKGIDRVLERTVAIKLLKPIRLDRGGGYPEGAKERFLQEGRMTASLHSEHTIQLYNLGSQEVEGQEYLFMVMEYLNGVTLSDYIDARGPLSPLEVVIVMRQIARSLYEAHTHPEQAFVHRDLKTVNIMTHEKPGHRLLGEDLHIKVLDFGIGKAINTGTKFDMHLTEQGELNVSPWYAAPEQLDPDCEIGPYTDLYALGLVAYECLVGSHPYPEASMTDAILRTLNPDPVRLPPRYQSGPLAPIIHKLLCKDVEGRYRSCHDLLEDLDNLELREVRSRRLEESGAPDSSGSSPQAAEQATAQLRGATVPLVEQTTRLEGVGVQTHLMAEDAFDPFEDRRTSKWEAVDASRPPAEHEAEHEAQAPSDSDLPVSLDELESEPDASPLTPVEAPALSPTAQVSSSEDSSAPMRVRVALVLGLILVGAGGTWMATRGTPEDSVAEVEASTPRDESPEPILDPSAPPSMHESQGVGAPGDELASEAAVEFEPRDPPSESPPSDAPRVSAGPDSEEPAEAVPASKEQVEPARTHEPSPSVRAPRLVEPAPPTAAEPPPTSEPGEGSASDSTPEPRSARPAPEATRPAPEVEPSPKETPDDVQEPEEGGADDEGEAVFFPVD